MAWFEDAFFLFTVRVFDASLTRANTNPKKIYCVDHALVRSVGSGVLVNAGHLLENLVFMALRRCTPEIHYFKGGNGREVDFVARMPDGSRVLVQVCESLADPRTRRRELAALDARWPRSDCAGARSSPATRTKPYPSPPAPLKSFPRGGSCSTSGDRTRAAARRPGRLPALRGG